MILNTIDERSLEFGLCFDQLWGWHGVVFFRICLDHADYGAEMISKIVFINYVLDAGKTGLITDHEIDQCFLKILGIENSGVLQNNYLSKATFCEPQFQDADQ